MWTFGTTLILQLLQRLICGRANINNLPSLASDRFVMPWRRAVALRACSYQSVKSILERELDRLLLETPAAERRSVEHPNIRGAEYFETGDTPPTIQ
jgi:hypothetical protein